MNQEHTLLPQLRPHQRAVAALVGTLNLAWRWMLSLREYPYPLEFAVALESLYVWALPLLRTRQLFGISPSFREMKRIASGLPVAPETVWGLVFLIFGLLLFSGLLIKARYRLPSVLVRGGALAALTITNVFVATNLASATPGTTGVNNYSLWAMLAFAAFLTVCVDLKRLLQPMLQQKWFPIHGPE